MNLPRGVKWLRTKDLSWDPERGSCGVESEGSVLVERRLQSEGFG